MSPRCEVRVLTDAVGNKYAAGWAVSGDAPERPWAVHLAGPDGYFRWVCFDLDASGGDAVGDARRLRGWLASLGIPFLECVSGPTGGRHIWIAADRVHPAAVNLIARLASSLLGSLDIKPLGASGAGVVRPPYSPHRVSGYSKPLGDVEVLFRSPGLTDVSAGELISLLESEGAFAAASSRRRRAPIAGVRGVVVDADGYHRLAGDRRDPSPRIRFLLDHGRPGPGDEVRFPSMSELQFAVLCGLVRARWSYRDVEALLEHAPGPEHARSTVHGPRRIPRPRGDARKILAADWDDAVDVVSSSPATGADSDRQLRGRIVAVTAAVQAAQARADASPGLWGADGLSRAARASRGRPSHRAVLDAVCWNILRAARSDVEVNTRRLAIDTGYSHEACRLALHALADTDHGRTPWLVRVQGADGVHGARYRLSDRFEAPPEKFSTGKENSELAPVGLPPRPYTDWTLLRDGIGRKLSVLAQDVFCAPSSLGRAAGRVLQYLTVSTAAHWRSTSVLAAAGRASHSRTLQLLRRLHRWGLVHRQVSGWAAESSADGRGCPAGRVAALALGVEGYLARRAARYAAEQRRWEWWQIETAWRRLKRKERRERYRAGTGLRPYRGDTLPGLDPAHARQRYPRRRDKSPDHPTALKAVHAAVG